MPSKPKTIDDYLSTVTAEQRAALEKTRKSILAAVPGAEECINYGVPAFRLDGKSLAGFSAGAKHCSYYPMSGNVVAALGQELANYETTKGSIHFPASRPLPSALVRKLVKARIAEIEGDVK